MNDEMVPAEGSTIPEKTGKFDEVVKQITLRKGEFQAELNNLPSTIIEALYHEITGKKEKLYFDFDKVKYIDYNDLNDLQIRLQQNTDKYHPVTSNMVVKLRLSDGRNFAFSGWNKFSSFDFKTQTRTTLVSLIFEFVIKSTLGTHNQYSIKIDLYSGIGNLPHLSRAGMERYLRSATSGDVDTSRIEIEYVDTLVARDYYDIIRTWFDNLKDAEYNFSPHKIKQFAPLMGRLLTAIVWISLVIPLWYAFRHSSTQTNFELALKPFIIFISWTFISLSLYNIFGDLAWEFFRKSYNVPTVSLTPGDQAGIKERNESNKKVAIRSAIWLFAIGITIAVNVFSNYIYDWIK